eukprot:SAG31_NODE_242_length_19350_cov_3.043998_15_plen_1073_part_00
MWCEMSKAGGPDGCRAFVLQLSVKIDDGTELLYTTNTQGSGGAGGQWQCRQGPVIWDHLYHGETYDARYEVEGWSSKPFGELQLQQRQQQWQPCVQMSPPGSASAANGDESKPSLGPLVPMSFPPIRMLETLPAVSMRIGIPRAADSSAPVNCWKEGKLAAVADECHAGTLTCSSSNLRSQIWLKCAPGEVIRNIEYAAFGRIDGDCEAGYSATPEPYGPRAGKPICSSPLTQSVVESLCVGKPECRLNASMAVVAGNVDPCPGELKRLVVNASGCSAVDPPPAPHLPWQTRWIFDFSQNIAGFATLWIPAGHGIPEGWRIRIEYAEILHGGVDADTYNTYCRTEGASGHPLRHEPCVPHPGSGHETQYMYIGDWNAANQTDEYVVKAASSETSTSGETEAIEYTPLFSAKGFRYAALSLHPPSSPVRTLSGPRAEPASLASFSLSSIKIAWRPTLKTLTARFIHTDVAGTGTLKLPAIAAQGNGTTGTPDILNRIHRATRYSALANLMSIPTDCPQRERRGWMGDAWLSSDQNSRQFDMQAFYSNYLNLIEHSQDWGCAMNPRGCAQFESPESAMGALPDVVPYDTIGQFPGTVVWQLAYVIITRTIYRHHGDDLVVRRHYPKLVSLMTSIERLFVNETTGLADLAGHGDWVCVGPDGPGQMGVPGSCPRTPASLVTAYYYAQSLGIMAELAVIVGESTNAVAEWSDRKRAAVKAFHEKYYDQVAQGYAPMHYPQGGEPWASVVEPRGSQTSNSMALALGAPPDEATRLLAFEALVENVMSHDEHLTAGIFGMDVLFLALSSGGDSSSGNSNERPITATIGTGRGDLVLSILLTDTYPGLGRMIQQNQTTLCEDWTCTAHHTAGPGSAAGHSDGRSLNHIMYGAFHSWMITKLGGMDTVSNATTTGWQHFVVAPCMHAVARLRSGGYSLKTRFGRAAVAWQYDAIHQVLQTNVTVPIGATAEVRHELTMPALSPAAAPVGTAAKASQGATALSLVAVREQNVELWRHDKSMSMSEAGPGLSHLPVGVLGLDLVNVDANDDEQRQQTTDQRQLVLASTMIGSGQYSFTSVYM